MRYESVVKKVISLNIHYLKVHKFKDETSNYTFK